MNLAKAKEYYALGLIDGFSVSRVDGDWLLVIDSKPHPYGATLETALGEEKRYSTLDSLHRDVERIMDSPLDNGWVLKV